MATKADRGAPVHLTPVEYQTILSVLEAAVTGEAVSPRLRACAWETWARLLVEGGHVSVKEFEELEKRYAPKR